MDDFTRVNVCNGTLEISDPPSDYIHIKQYIGINTNDTRGTLNYKISTQSSIDKRRLNLYTTLYKIGKLSFINISHIHVIEMNKFLMIKKMLQMGDTVLIDNVTCGEIVIEDCTIGMMNKCIRMVEDYIKENNKRTFMDYIEYLLM